MANPEVQQQIQIAQSNSNGRDWYQVKSALSALGDLKDPEAVPFLVQQFSTHANAANAEQKQAGYYAASALQKIAHPSCIPPVQAIFQNDQALSANAARILVAVGPAALPALTEAAKHTDWIRRLRVVEVIREARATWALPVVATLVGDSSWDVRLVAGKAAAELQPPPPAPAQPAAAAPAPAPTPSVVPAKTVFSPLWCYDGSGPVKSVAILPDGKRGLSGGIENTMRLWDLDSGAELRSFKADAAAMADPRMRYRPPMPDFNSFGPDSEITAVAALPTGDAVSGSGDGSLCVWNLGTGQLLRRLEPRFSGGMGDEIHGIAALPDGQRLLVAASRLTLWDCRAGRELDELRGHQGFVTAVVALPDGRRALSAGSIDHAMRLWDVDNRQELRCFLGHADRLCSVALLPDGRRALSGSEDRTLRLWDLETGAELRCLTGHGDYVKAVAVLPDGRHAVSGSDDNTLRLWDLESGSMLGHCAGDACILSVAVCPRTSRVLIGDAVGRVTLLQVNL